MCYFCDVLAWVLTAIPAKGMVVCIPRWAVCSTLDCKGKSTHHGLSAQMHFPLRRGSLQPETILSTILLVYRANSWSTVGDYGVQQTLGFFLESAMETYGLPPLPQLCWILVLIYRRYSKIS